MGHLLWSELPLWIPKRQDAASGGDADGARRGRIAGPENPGEGASRGSRAGEVEDPPPEECEAEASE